MGPDKRVEITRHGGIALPIFTLPHVRSAEYTRPKAENRIRVVVHALKLSVLEKNREIVCWPAGSCTDP